MSTITTTQKQIRQARHKAIANTSAEFRKIGINLPHGAAHRIARGRPLSPTQYHSLVSQGIARVD